MRSVASFFDSSLVPKRKPWGPQYAVSHRQCHCFIHGSGVFRQCHSSLPNDALSSIVIHCFHSAICSLAESSSFSVLSTGLGRPEANGTLKSADGTLKFADGALKDWGPWEGDSARMRVDARGTV